VDDHHVVVAENFEILSLGCCPVSKQHTQKENGNESNNFVRQFSDMNQAQVFDNPYLGDDQGISRLDRQLSAKTTKTNALFEERNFS
jgi:hypothetical protein